MFRLFEPLAISTGFSCPIYPDDNDNFDAHTYREVVIRNAGNETNDESISVKHKFEIVDKGFTVDNLGLRQKDQVTVRDNFSDRCLRVVIRILKYTTLALALGVGLAYVAGLIGYSIVPITTLAIGLGIAAGMCFIAMMIHRWIANSHEEAYFSTEQKGLRGQAIKEKLA